ncbi:MAG: hypothetical protein LHW62_08780, partial [Candidatus Cloacimonetes bacterium]|nr:hypothetical protein [Candidatus Cloacimonadota bacterium]
RAGGTRYKAIRSPYISDGVRGPRKIAQPFCGVKETRYKAMQALSIHRSPFTVYYSLLHEALNL